MTSNTLGWEFEYHLTDRIDCKSDIQNRLGINFITEIYGKHSQKAITGFKIVSQNIIKENAENEAKQKATRLTQLLTASSGTHSKFTMRGDREITESGDGKLGTTYPLSCSIQNNAILSMSDDVFQQILEGTNPDLMNKIVFVSKARQAEKSKDFESIIKYLVQACNENPQNELKKFKYLRNAITHNEKPLHKSTREGLIEGFGDGYFKLTSKNQFDFESDQNTQNIKIQSKEFLKAMHIQLRQELDSM